MAVALRLLIILEYISILATPYRKASPNLYSYIYYIDHGIPLFKTAHSFLDNSHGGLLLNNHPMQIDNHLLILSLLITISLSLFKLHP